MTNSRTYNRMARGAAVVGTAVLLLLGSGCGGGEAERGNAERGNAPATVNQQSAPIPVAGGQPTGPAPEFTSHVPSIPAGGVTLEELHQQGKTEVIR